MSLFAGQTLQLRWYRVIALTGLAALANMMSVEIAGGAMIFTGAFVYMALIMVLPAMWAVPIAFAATLPTYLASGYPFAMFVSVMEAAWLACFLRFHRRSFILLDLTFWIVIGLPFGTWLMSKVSVFPQEILVLILAKQMLTQLAATAFGAFVAVYTPFETMLIGGRGHERRLREQVFNFMFVLAVVPITVIAIGFSILVRKTADEEDNRLLREAAVRVARELDLFLEMHREAVVTAAHLIERDIRGESHRVLEEMREGHPDFLTMLVTDPEGRIMAAAPADLLERGRGTSVADRKYFIDAREQMAPQVSGVFRGRGFGTDLLVAMSAPLRGANGEFAGVVQGAVEIERFGKLVVEAGQREELAFIVTDQFGRVIYGSPETHVRVLSHLRYHPLAHFLVEAPRTAQFYNLDVVDGPLHAAKAVGVRSPNIGLMVIAQRPQLTGLMNMSEFYLMLGAVILGVSLIAAMVARLAGKSLSGPLEHFARTAEAQAGTGEVQTISPPPFGTPPKEIELVYTAFNYLALSLRESYDELKKANAVLDQRVAERTQQLQAAYDSKSSFLAMTGHEIRTPLNAILGLTEALLDQPMGTEARERLETIRGSGVMLLQVVNDLLDLSQAEAGRLELRPDVVDVHAVCRDVFRLFELRARRQGLALSLEAEDGAAARWVMADGPRLRQVLINLVGNAIKFTQVGAVRLRCEVTELAGGDRLRLQFAVIDTGPGIPEDKQARLFEPYYRVETNETRGVPGTGLGLTICRSLVGLMGGSLQLESQSGRGTTFFFSIEVPRAAAPTIPATQTTAPFGFKKLSVLAADDNLANQEVLRALLEDRCDRLVVVSSGREAIDYLTKEKFDVALLDLEMPGSDGLSVVEALQAAPDAPSAGCWLVAVSAHPRDQMRPRCLRQGFHDYVEKPIDRRVLFQTIETLTTSSRS